VGTSANAVFAHFVPGMAGALGEGEYLRFDPAAVLFDFLEIFAAVLRSGRNTCAAGFPVPVVVHVCKNGHLMPLSHGRRRTLGKRGMDEFDSVWLAENLLSPKTGT